MKTCLGGISDGNFGGIFEVIFRAIIRESPRSNSKVFGISERIPRVMIGGISGEIVGATSRGYLFFSKEFSTELLEESSHPLLKEEFSVESSDFSELPEEISGGLLGDS